MLSSCIPFFYVLILTITLRIAGPAIYSSRNDRSDEQLSGKWSPLFHRRLKIKSSPKEKLRVLYIVTTLAEYNTGTRHTVRNSDRLQETLIPVLSEGVHSMVQAGYHVDVYLVCNFVLQPDRRKLIEKALPKGAGLDVWNDASPMGYDTSKQKFEKIETKIIHLARQHRFVIKDKLLDYDMFVNFEDDMLIKAEHIEHFIFVTNELKRLESLAPDEPPSNFNRGNAEQTYYGAMTKKQLRRMLPGLIRVEVLLDEEQYPAQSNTGPVPVDLKFQRLNRPRHIDSKICCHVSDRLSAQNRPRTPSADKIMLWETNILPLGVRKMPEESKLGWVAMLRGPNQKDLDAGEIIGDYWTNRHKDYYGTKQSRPAPQEFKYINNQGGWMATREQIWRWHTEICPGGFLPPYESPHYNYDGLDMRNVEWYSGGMQLSTVRHACNMQRIIMLDPEHFSKSLLYHTSNNKQRQLTGKKEEMFSKADTLLGQLNTIKKRAEMEIQ